MKSVRSSAKDIIKRLANLGLRRLEVETILGIAFPSMDVLLLWSSSWIAYSLSFKSELDVERFQPGWYFILPITTIFTVSFLIAGIVLRLYVEPTRISAVVRSTRVGSGVLSALFLTIGILYFMSPARLEPSRLFLAVLGMASFLMVLGGRTLMTRMIRWLAAYGIGLEKVLILGDGREARAVHELFSKHQARRYKLAGYVTGSDTADAEPSGMLGSKLGSLDSLATIIKRHSIDKMVLAIPGLHTEQVLNVANLCSDNRVALWILPDHFQLMISRVDEDELAGLPLMTISEVRLKGVSRVVKRLVDILISALLLVFASGIMVAVAIAIRLTGSGSVFFAQQRMGRDGRKFMMLKFRSMRLDADLEGQGWTVENDDRTTTVGRFIRRFSMDELPQLINVLRGEMSLVGPRPELPDYVREFARRYPRYMQRHHEKAGMTGWAQVNGLRGDVSISERTLYDLYYVENWSVGLDMQILLRTVLEVLRGRAY
tara:strand:- start:588 stop:2051 length:1464 start_codon:yes stop_codon:yes gene_type:complete